MILFFSSKDKWRGVVHHVVNEHKWKLGQCDHEELPGDADGKAYLEKGSPPQLALSEVVMDRTLLKKIDYYVNFRLETKHALKFPEILKIAFIFTCIG